MTSATTITGPSGRTYDFSLADWIDRQYAALPAAPPTVSRDQRGELARLAGAAAGQDRRAGRTTSRSLSLGAGGA